jgi:hypothetical protein
MNHSPWQWGELIIEASQVSKVEAENAFASPKEVSTRDKEFKRGCNQGYVTQPWPRFDEIAEVFLAAV